MVAQQRGTGGVGRACGRQAEHCDSVWQLHSPAEPPPSLGEWEFTEHTPEPAQNTTMSELLSNKLQGFNSHPGILKKDI